MADAITEGATTVQLKHLEQRALSVAQCRNILKKIKEGENLNAQIEAEVEQLRAELGLPVKSTVLNDSLSPVENISQLDNIHEPSLRKKVGQPKPKRRQVGTK